MQNTLVISEKRNITDKFKNWYKEKLIETGKSKKFEEKFDKRIKFKKNSIKVLGLYLL